MTRITHSDQVLLLLRERLRRLDSPAARRSDKGGRVEGATQRPLMRLQELAALNSLSEDDLQRSLVRALLIEGLGEAIGNEAEFQMIVHEVHRIIHDSPEGRELLALTSRELRADE